MNQKHNITYTLILLLIITNAIAQEVIPEVGKPMPAFTLNHVEHFKKKSVSLNDFKGKWLFLDFWYRGCVNSVKSLPKMDEIQRHFKDELQVLIIGVTAEISFGKGIQPVLEKLYERQNLHVPIAYDSALKQKWNIRAFPHIIIIDPNGIVHSITAGQDLTIKRIQDLIDGKNITFYPKGIDRPEFDPVKCCESDNSLVYRSIFTRWNGEVKSLPPVKVFIEDLGKTEMKVSRFNLKEFYNLAYFGKAYWTPRDTARYQVVFLHPILEMKDTTLFEYDFLTGKGIYNYQLNLPPGVRTAEAAMHLMQSDLKNIFGFEASVEERLVPVLRLVALPGAKQKLQSKEKIFSSTNIQGTGNLNGDGGAAGFILKHTEMWPLIDSILRYINEIDLPLFDDTGITYPIDITMDVLMTDEKAVIRELNRNGLDLIKSQHRMKVLVIRDGEITKNN